MRSLYSTLLLAGSASAFGPGFAWNSWQPRPTTWDAPSSQTQSSHAGMSATATIDVGVLHGTTTSLPAATASINKFLGVPFAKSPPLRFAPPEKPDAFSSPINATAISPACIQQFLSRWNDGIGSTQANGMQFQDRRSSSILHQCLNPRTVCI